MGIASRAAVAIGGPGGGTTWYDAGQTLVVAQAGANAQASFTATTSAPGNIVSQIITKRHHFYQESVSQAQTYQDSLSTSVQGGGVIQGLYGFQVTAASNFAASATLILSLSVYRTIGTIATSFTPGTVTSIPLATPLLQTIPSGSVLTLVHSAATHTTITTTVANNVGVSSLAIPSTALSSYAAGDVLTWQVGNSAAFGWTVTNSGGTPLLPAFAAVSAPIIPTSVSNPAALNTSIVTGASNGVTSGFQGIYGGVTTAQSGFLPLIEGDCLTYTIETSTSTVASIPPLTLTAYVI